jgi:hypothetical protein
MDCYACLNVAGKMKISPGEVIYDGKYWIVDHAYPTKLLGWLVIVLKTPEFNEEFKGQKVFEYLRTTKENSISDEHIINLSKKLQKKY